MNNHYNIGEDTRLHKLATIVLSLLVGLLAGGCVVLYRIVLTYAEELSFSIYDFIRIHKAWIFVWFICLIIIGYIIGKLVAHNEMLSGSGIPQVKGILMGYFKGNWLHTFLGKFVGGTLGIVGGLSLGREGPSIQLGACIAEGVSKRFTISKMQKRILIASGASAGLAAAFNAPLAGVLFVLEEIFKYFSPLILLATMGAAIVADFISKQFFGFDPIFNFNTQIIPLHSYWLLILLGLLLGFSGVIYNITLLGIQRFYKKISFLPSSKRPIVPLLLAGVLGIIFPFVLGGGHRIIPQLTLETGLCLLIALLIIKFLFSLIAFGSGAPGGIFFPLLIIGGLIGAIFGKVSIGFLGIDPNLFYSIVVVAMAGYFTAIVRAPITGIVLISEMTRSFDLLLPLTIVSMIAYIVADLLKCLPIYDSLLENQLEAKNLVPVSEEHSQKIVIPLVVHYESEMIGKKVKQIPWPKRCLLISINRRETEIIPKGDTSIEAGDYLLVVTDLNNEWFAREKLYALSRYEV